MYGVDDKDPQPIGPGQLGETQVPPKSAAFTGLIDSLTGNALVGVLSHAFGFAGEESKKEFADAVLRWGAGNMNAIMENYEARRVFVPWIAQLIERHMTAAQRRTLSDDAVGAMREILAGGRSDWTQRDFVRAAMVAAAERELASVAKEEAVESLGDLDDERDPV